MWYVYRGINYALGEVYFGVSQDPDRRIDGSHCRGGTKAVSDWECGVDHIRWWRLSAHRSQRAATQRAHRLERTYRHPDGFDVIRTAGI